MSSKILCYNMPVKALVFIFFCLSISLNLHAQISVSGPSCVLAAQPYHYKITWNWAADSTAQVCVTGGKLLTAGTSCVTASPETPIRIAWNEGEKQGRIQVTAGGQTFSFACTISTVLKGGTIPSVSAQQLVDTNSVPQPLDCSSATGGDCQPAYVYQWEQSSDRVNWHLIEGASAAVFQFASPVKSALFFRRKVTDTRSHSEGYSNVAAIFIKENNENQ
jgi:hypothetical protein